MKIPVNRKILHSYICDCVWFMLKIFYCTVSHTERYMYNYVFSTLASSSTINNNSHNITIIHRKKYNSHNGLENVQLQWPRKFKCVQKYKNRMSKYKNIKI